MKNPKVTAIVLAIITLALIIFGLVCGEAKADPRAEAAKDYNPDDYSTMYILGDKVNGRETPERKGTIGCIYYTGDRVKAVNPSDNFKWIRVLGGESGTVWVYMDYISETVNDYDVKNMMAGKVRIRKTPEKGGVVGYVKRGATVTIHQTLFGWGRTDKGWVDLSCFCEVK